MPDNQRLSHLLKELQKEFPGFKAAIFLHRNEQGAEVISPLMQTSNLKDMLVTLNRTKAGLDSLINDIVSRSLPKN